MIAVDLSGKTAVITGATGELGRAMVRTFARAGANVVICYLQNESMARKLVSELKPLGVRGLAIRTDVTDMASVVRMRNLAARMFGPPEIIVNNAIINYRHADVLAQPVEDYDSQYRSCILHNVFMAKAFVPGMIKKGWGRVIAISTELAVMCSVGCSAYVSGKRGMDGVLHVLAREVGKHGITVNQVAPGWTISENRPEKKSKAAQAYRNHIPLGRKGKAQDIANVVVFLASDLAGFVTGVFVPVSGGTVMTAI